jgi:predicted nucleic acid-binding protein
MIKAFLDANILFAASYSETSSARDLLLASARGEVIIQVSADVLEEANRNLTKKAPDKLKNLDPLFKNATTELVSDPSREQVWATEKYVAQKDAPIIAAAINAKPDFFVTYDRRHLIDPPEVTEKSGLVITTPDVVIQAIENKEEDG